MADLMDTLLESMKRRAAEPEAVEVRVVGILIVTEDIARVVAPMLAQTLHPDRSFGRVLFMERDPGDNSWTVAVEDLGPKRFTNRNGIPAPRA